MAARKAEGHGPSAIVNKLEIGRRICLQDHGNALTAV
jgi:hypothetical protein